MNALEPRRVTDNPARWPEALWLLCHFAAIALICTLRFAVNFDYLLMGIDGAIGTLGQYPGVLFTDPARSSTSVLISGLVPLLLVPVHSSIRSAC